MLGDDNTDPNITTDDSGMSVVTVSASPDRESPLLSLVLFGILMWTLYSEDR